MVYWYATVIYHGFDKKKDAQIRKAARDAGIRNTTGSGFNLLSGERDLGFRLRNDQKEALEKALESLECKIDFYN